MEKNDCMGKNDCIGKNDCMGKNDVVKHYQSNSHLEQAKALKGQPNLSFQAHLEDDLQRTEAELHVAVFNASSNVPLAFHDRLSPTTIRKIFPDSKIASKYHSASIKATCMLK